MASDGASGADRSDNSSSSDRSDGAESVSKKTSDKVRDAVSGDTRTTAAAEATAADRSASQSKMAAEGQVAKDRVAQAANLEVVSAATVVATPAVANANAIPSVTLAQTTTTGTLTEPALPSAGQIARGLRAATPAGAAVVAAVGLGALNDIAADNRIAAAGETLGLDMTTVEGVLGANAYASAKETMSHGLGGVMTGLDYSAVETRGATREAAARAVAQNEMVNPGDWAMATRAGDPGARERVQSAIDGAIANLDAGVPAPAATDPLDLSGITLERTSAVDPALSANSTRARALLAATGMQNWRAHHVIPFAEVAKLPAAAQQAMVAAGWRMDSLENLVALPADIATYRAPPNSSLLPVHTGSHPVYSAQVGAALQAAAVNFPNMTGAEIRASLAAIESSALNLLTNKVSMHPYIR